MNNSKPAMIVHVNRNRKLFERDPMIYGHFLEHFHRQIYGGVYEPGSPLADEDGFRTDVIEALKEIQTPIIRWPGGCFVSSYHWKKGVGKDRVPSYDKAWRVEDPNTFGTDEFVKLCRKIGCEPYICVNAGTGTEEEMSDWVEYCNLENEGEFARQRIANGNPEPYNVKYWSIGNENYGDWELGAKTLPEWGSVVRESTKLIKHVDPFASLSAAALGQIDWDLNILKNASERLEWISLHAYWDPEIQQENTPQEYEKYIYFTNRVGDHIRRTRGLLMALELDHKVRIAFDEWNLRGWYHPNIHRGKPTNNKDEYITPRDGNDINSIYTMADAVFSACFLNECLRNADIVGMANFSPVVNTRGAIYVHPEGIVKRTTFYVFKMYTQLMGDVVIDSFVSDQEMYHISSGKIVGDVTCFDTVATINSVDGSLAVSVVNKHADEAKRVQLNLGEHSTVKVITLCGRDKEDYNDVDQEFVVPFENPDAILSDEEGCVELVLPPHSVNIVVSK